MKLGSRRGREAAYEGVVAQTMDPDSFGYESWLCHMFAVKSKRHHFISLCLGLLIVIIPIS